MNRRKNRTKFGPTDRIAAFAEATQAYAEGLDDPDLANIYWGKALGLWQALAILTAEERARPARPLQSPAALYGPPRATPRTGPAGHTETGDRGGLPVTGNAARLADPGVALEDLWKNDALDQQGGP